MRYLLYHIGHQSIIFRKTKAVRAEVVKHVVVEHVF